MKRPDWKTNLLVAAAGLLLFVPFLGSVHLFDWDEINFAECAREMLVTADYSTVRINFAPFWEKPPLFIWMQALSMNDWGVNEFAARLPNAVCGVITLLIVFNIGKQLYDRRFGLLWALAFAGSFLPHFYFKSGIIDPWFNLFIFCSIYYFILFSNNENASQRNSTNNRRLALSGLFIGLAVLTKGPVALLIFSLCVAVYFVMKKFRLSFITWRHVLIFMLAAALSGGAWFAIELMRGRTDIIAAFFDYQLRLLQTEDSGHGGPFFYHFVVLLIGCFPASLLALGAFRKSGGDTPFQQLFKRWMLILLLVVLIVFSIVETKIIHYSSLCYFPLSFLAAYTINKIIEGTVRWKGWLTWSVLLTGLPIAAALLTVPFIGSFKNKLIHSGLIRDPFALANLEADVPWSGWEWVPGALLLAGLAAFLLFRSGHHYRKALLSLFTASLLTVNMASVLIAPKVEQYTQGAAIEFYEKHVGKGIPVETIGFKSYAHLFYTKRTPAESDEGHTHFVSKEGYPEEGLRKEGLTEIYRKNGFVFWDNQSSCFLHGAK